MTRNEHLEWAKQRAREYLKTHDYQNAVASMLSDLRKHDELAPIAKSLGMVGIMAAASGDPKEVSRFIEGFN